MTIQNNLTSITQLAHAITLDPSAYTPHSTLRDNQVDVMHQLAKLYTQGVKYIFIEAPTGSGKSFIASALSAIAPVTVVVSTLPLGGQYRDRYNFDFIKGSQEYPCALDSKINKWARENKTPTAHDCHYPNKNNCPAVGLCQYQIAKHKALQSQRMCCTYLYYLLSPKAQERVGILVLDECHFSVEACLASTEILISEKQRRIYHLPEFPFADGYGADAGGMTLEEQHLSDLLEWFNRSIALMSVNDDILDSTPEGARRIKFYKRLTKIRDEIETGLWFARRTPDRQLSNYSLDRDGLFLRSLNSQMIAKKFWANKDLIIFMSATIGDPKPLATRLGIKEGEYHFLSYPHPLPVEYRPIFNLHGPKMVNSNLKANPGLYEVQGKIIARFIREIDPAWRGIVLTTSNTKVTELRKSLYAKFSDRLLIPPERAGVNQRIDQFLKDERKGIFIVDTVQGLGHGLNLAGDLGRWCVVAGIDFSFQNPTDALARAMLKQPGGMEYGLWQAALDIMQAPGRVSRGDLNVNYAALADGGMTENKMTSRYSQWFKVAIQEWDIEKYGYKG